MFSLTSRSQSEPVVVICAYCGRMRLPQGDWQLPAPGDPRLPLRWSDVMVSHGCCPECFEREMAKCRVRTGAPEWRPRRW